MKLVITAEINPDGESIQEIRDRIQGHASVWRRMLRDGLETTGIGFESYILWNGKNCPKLTKITAKVEP